MRRSYEPAGLGPESPVVWFFGGSTTWGEGQRDLYTVPSQVARLAEAQGVPLRVVNYGERGRAQWEEMLRFERALADGPAPDVVVFYDGVNELKTQDPASGGIPSDDPTRFETSGSLPEAVPAPFSAEVDDPPGPWFEELVANSLVLQLADRLGLETPASADDGVTNEQIAERSLAVYRRGRRLSAGLAEAAGVQPLFFWQPLFSNAIAGSPGALAREQLDPPTIDISRVLDVVPYDTVYLDGAHTNERGAELVGAAMLEPLLAALGTDAAAGSGS